MEINLVEKIFCSSELKKVINKKLREPSIHLDALGITKGGHRFV